MHLRVYLALFMMVVATACDDSGESTPTTDQGPDSTAGDMFIPSDGPPPPQECIADTSCADSEYCLLAQNSVSGVCVTGCRPDPDNCTGRSICGPDRLCIPDPNCIADNECDADEYCDSGSCRQGCRPGEFDTCAPLDGGQATVCDPGSRECTAVVICCAANDACSEELPSECQDVAFGARFCVNPNPCENRCRNDDSCADEEYCDDSGHCATGCRLEDRAACPNEICDPETRECVSESCAADEECPADQFCEVGSSTCVLGCRSEPDSCPDGSFCNQARQCVEGCTEDAQCAARNGDGWLCVRGICEPPCANDDDCSNGELCLGDRCELGCRDDALEDNDDENSALALQFPGERFDSQPLVACPQDADWFRFDTPGPGWNVTVEVDFTHEAGDIDLRVYAPNDRVHTSATRDDDEQVVLENAADGSYAVEIFSRGVEQNTYEFSLVFTPSGACMPDAAEPGDNVVGGAVVLDLAGEQANTVVRERTICGDGDEDWYSMALGSGDGLRVELSMLADAPQAPAELDFAIFGPGAPGPDAMPVFVPNSGGGGDGGNPPFVAFEAPRANPQVRAGDYFVRVRGVAANQTGDYLLGVRLDRARPLCLVDPDEPNEAAVGASDLMEIDDFTRPANGGGVELRPLVDLALDRWLCEGDEDWFEFTLQAGDDISVSLERDEPLEGAVLLELLAADGTVVAGGANNRPLNVARGQDLPGGTYRARVSAEGGVQAQYTVRLNRTPGIEICEPDRFENGAGNDSRESAPEVLPGDLVDLSLCGDDADYYRVRLNGAGDLTVSLNFAHERANLDVDIFQDDNPQSENADSPAGHSVTDNEQVALPDRSPGEYTVRVASVGGGSTQYTMQIEYTPRDFVCVDDPDEPNDELGRAIELPAGDVEREDQWLCERVPTEADFFEVPVVANITRTVAVDFLYGDDGDLVLEAFNAGGDPLANTGGLARGNSKQCLIIEPHIGDRSIFVRVAPLVINGIVEDDERLDYRLRVLDGEVCDDLQPAAPGLSGPASRRRVERRLCRLLNALSVGRGKPSPKSAALPLPPSHGAPTFDGPGPFPRGTKRALR